jgi:hypothetical protein
VTGEARLCETLRKIEARFASTSASPSNCQGAHNVRGLANQLGFGRLPAIVVSSISQCPFSQPPKWLPSIRFGTDRWTLARLRNAALYCLRHIAQRQLLASRATCWRSTPISAEVNRSGKIKKAVALVLSQLRSRQLHRLLGESGAAALIVAPNPAAAERDIRRARRWPIGRCP